MDHSGLEESSGKRSRVCVRGGVMQCLRPQGIDGDAARLGEWHKSSPGAYMRCIFMLFIIISS